MPVSADINRHLTGEFENAPLTGDMKSEVLCFCLFLPFLVWDQRKNLLELSGEPYVMFAGTWPCCGFEKPCPSWCLWLESFCCIPRGLAGNRFMTQTRLNLRNSGIDRCMTCCHIFPKLECAIARVCCSWSKEHESLYTSGCGTCPCSHCQNELAIKNFKRDREGFAIPPAALIEELPEHFTRVNRGPAAAPPAQAAPM